MGTLMEEKSECLHVCDYSNFQLWLSIVHNESACLDGQQLLITNLHDGVDQYVLPTMHLAQSYHHTIFINAPLQVLVAQECGWVVVGGDDGFMRVFDYQTGTFRGKLDHGSGMYVS